MTGQELVAIAMRRLNYTEPAELARHLGLTAYSSPRRVKRWLDGKNEPEFEPTIALLNAVGAINWDVLTFERELSTPRQGQNDQPPSVG